MDTRIEDVRQRLRMLLRRNIEVYASLLELIDDPGVSPTQLADAISVLQKYDIDRDVLVEELMSASQRAAIEAAQRKPVRLLVLDALDEMKVPQNAAFLQEYIWGRFGINLETRGFGTLRRDERRSWQRNPDKRAVYVAPALGPTGDARPDYMTRSSWDLSRRIILGPPTERVLGLKKIRILLQAQENDDELEAPWTLDRALERYAHDLLNIPVPQPLAAPTGSQEARWASSLWRVTGPRSEWRGEVQRRVADELALLGPDDEADRVRAAVLLAELPTETKLWGVDSISSPSPVDP
jgi:hypothetical protein